MESLSTIQRLRQTLEWEEASEALTMMPAETYIKLAGYAQKLRATTGSNNDDASGRLAKKQLWLMEGMTRRLLHLRLVKAAKEEATTQQGDELASSSKKLLPEERYINDVLEQ